MALSGASELTSSAMNIINIVSKPNARRRNQLFSEVESHQGYLRRFAMAQLQNSTHFADLIFIDLDIVGDHWRYWSRQKLHLTKICR